MGNNRPIKTKCWIAYLVFKKCVYKRTKASHVHYKCPKCFRTITFRKKDKEIPPLHIQTNLRTLGITMKEFYEWAENNC